MIDPLLAAVLGLCGAIALGAVAALAGVFSDPRAAIAALNAVGIRVAFPALVACALGRAPVPSGLGWLVGPLALVLSALVGIALGRIDRRAREEGPVMALVIAFGNVAYLGVPIATAVFGEAHADEVTIAATAQVAVAVTLGPALLARLAHGSFRGGLRRALAQPLFLALPVGLALRLLPDAPRAAALALLGPFGEIAAPLGAFVLGAYVALHHDALRRLDGGIARLAAARLVLVPAVALGIAVAFARAGLLSPIDLRLAVLLAAMPAAVSTFAIAHDEGHGEARAVSTIVVTSVLAILTVPAWLAIATAAG